MILKFHMLTVELLVMCFLKVVPEFLDATKSFFTFQTHTIPESRLYLCGWILCGWVLTLDVAL